MSSKKACPRGCGGVCDTGAKQCLACMKGISQVGGVVPQAPTPEAEIAGDREKKAAAEKLSSLKRKYDVAVSTIERQESELRALNVLGQGRETFTIEPKTGHRTSEGTAVAVYSDFHIEETVDPNTIGGLNEFNLDIAKARIEKLFQGTLRLVNLLNQDINITTLVLALLGDFITNNIHEELNDVTSELPMHALVLAQNHLISGIEFLLTNLPAINIVAVCHSGNHARTTHKTHVSAENGHSLEYLLYLHLASYFRHESRIKFIIPEGYHSYLNIYGTTIRFHHGHSIRYSGGVGGIYIPVNKAIAQWNKARPADLDVFGHYHSMRDGGNFICNGSLIGYNAFALSIKADYEKPKQALFLMDKKRGRTATWPILLEDK